MEYRICPSCGSTYFISSRSGEKIVFHVSDSRELITVPGQTFDEVYLTIDPLRFYCGACSWGGGMVDLGL